MIMVALVLIGAINWGATAFGYNLVEILNTQVDHLFGTETRFNKIIYILVALSALKLAFKKSTWLPFLGYMAFPSTALIPTIENTKGDTIIKVNVRPNTRVAYWSSFPRKTKGVPLVEEAYDDFSNSGVVKSDENGVAELKILVGSSYIVPSGREIPRHVHYRELDLDHGMMGDLKTEYY
jgi:uncharacterized membrane protein YuzA (DUF378 family)